MGIQLLLLLEKLHLYLTGSSSCGNSAAAPSCLVSAPLCKCCCQTLRPFHLLCYPLTSQVLMTGLLPCLSSAPLWHYLQGRGRHIKAASSAKPRSLQLAWNFCAAVTGDNKGTIPGQPPPLFPNKGRQSWNRVAVVSSVHAHQQEEEGKASRRSQKGFHYKFPLLP